MFSRLLCTGFFITDYLSKYTPHVNLRSENVVQTFKLYGNNLNEISQFRIFRSVTLSSIFLDLNETIQITKKGKDEFFCLLPCEPYGANQYIGLCEVFSFPEVGNPWNSLFRHP